MIKNFLIGLGLTTLTVVVLQFLLMGFGIELGSKGRAATVLVPFAMGVMFSLASLQTNIIFFPYGKGDFRRQENYDKAHLQDVLLLLASWGQTLGERNLSCSYQERWASKNYLSSNRP